MSGPESAGAPRLLEDAVRQVAAAVDALVPDGPLGEVPPAAVQLLLVSAVRLFVARREADSGELAPFADPDSVTPTEVMVVASAMLRAANLEPFELSMWNSWSTGG